MTSVLSLRWRTDCIARQEVEKAKDILMQNQAEEADVHEVTISE